MLAVSELLALKQNGFIVAFIVTTTLQFIFTHHGSVRDDIRNWPVNLAFAAINGLISSFFILAATIQFVQFVALNKIGILPALNLSQPLLVLLSILVLDLSTYLWHVANHKISFLWRFHAVHHSDTHLDTTSALRFHFGEVIISFCFRLIVVALFGLSIEGLLAFEIVFQFFNLFEHGNIRLAQSIENGLGKFFITPALHRKHHSQIPSELNSNFGTIFSFWDLIFNTRCESHSREYFKLGLPGQATAFSFVNLVLRPFLRKRS